MIIKIILIVAIIGGLVGLIASGGSVRGFFSGFFKTGWGCVRVLLTVFLIIAFIVLIFLLVGWTF